MAAPSGKGVFIIWGMLGGGLAGLLDAAMAVARFEDSLEPTSWLVLAAVSAFTPVLFGGLGGLVVQAVYRRIRGRPSLAGVMQLSRSSVFWAVLALFGIGLVAASVLFIRVRGIQLDAIDFRLPGLVLLALTVCLAGGAYGKPNGRLAARLSYALAALAIGVLWSLTPALGRYPGVLEVLQTRTAALKPVFSSIRFLLDKDGDGFASYICQADCDCDDGNPSISPAALDIPNNGVDEDCSGEDLVRQGASKPPIGGDNPRQRALSLRRDIFRPPYNMVLLSIDALRADHMHSYGYQRITTPNIDRFAAQHVRFHQARSQGPSTRFAFPVILTGRYFSGLKLKKGTKWYRLLKENVTFAERLKREGYRTIAILPYFRFKEHSGFQQGFDVWTNRLAGDRDPTWEPTADLVTERGLKHLEELTGVKEPWFLWLHYFDPHGAYLRHPQQKSFGKERVDRYDGELLYTDRYLQMVLARIRELGIWEETAIIVMSDHGEGHGRQIDHGIAYHGFSLFDSEIRVPLVVRLPGARPAVITQSVGIIDVPATILELAGVEVKETGEAMHGVSLVPYLLGENPPRPPLLSELLDDDSRQMALIDWPHKLIWNIRLNRFSLYNLEKDPNERLNLAGQAPETLERLLNRLRLMRLEMEE